MEALLTLGPVYAFMLLPIWIPLIAVAFTAVGEALAALRSR